jgi:hypothetical protein
MSKTGTGKLKPRKADAYLLYLPFYSFEKIPSV